MPSAKIFNLGVTQKLDLSIQVAVAFAQQISCQDMLHGPIRICPFA
jgi:hypothetical protein